MTSPTPLLDKITNPADLRKLPSEDLRQLADELRYETISAVSETGGHLGAGHNLNLVPPHELGGEICWPAVRGGGPCSAIDPTWVGRIKPVSATAKPFVIVLIGGRLLLLEAVPV